jgi:hypothetical protein
MALIFSAECNSASALGGDLDTFLVHTAAVRKRMLPAKICTHEPQADVVVPIVSVDVVTVR